MGDHHLIGQNTLSADSTLETGSVKIDVSSASDQAVSGRINRVEHDVHRR
jgi:ribosomal protein L31